VNLTRTEEIKLWLLRALLNPPAEHFDAMDSFSEADWSLIRISAAQHRLRPMLFTLARDRWADRPVPAQIQAAWQGSYARTAKRQFERRAMLLEVTAELTAAGIDYAVLKGGAMLGGAYPDPAVRPVRDLDLLVRPAEVNQASDLLIARLRCVPQSQVTGVVLEDYSVHKHVEPLWSETRGIAIELHTRLVDRPRRGDGGLLFDPDRLLARTEPRLLGSRALACLAWPETLLHLIAHGVHDHQLNNGPLLLTDVLAIVRHAEVDWDSFWRIAEEGGWTGAARLTNDLLAYLTSSDTARFGDSAGQPTPEPVLRAAALLLLQKRDEGEGVSGWSRLHARPSLGALLLRLRQGLRRRSTGAATAGVASPLAKAGAMLRALGNRSDRSEIARSAAVYHWLGNGSDSA
jgi:hypothetical protein